MTIDNEPIHSIKIPQHFRIVKEINTSTKSSLETSKLGVQKQQELIPFQEYLFRNGKKNSEEDSESENSHEDTIRRMNEFFIHVIDICENKIRHMTKVFDERFHIFKHGSGDRERIDSISSIIDSSEDVFITEYVEIQNKILDYRIIHFVSDFRAFQTIVNFSLQVLECNSSSPLLSMAIKKSRSIKNAKTSKITSGFKAICSYLFTQKSWTVINKAYSLLQEEEDPQLMNLEGLFATDDYDENEDIENPIIRNRLNLVAQVESCLSKNSYDALIETKLKLAVCKSLNYIMDARENFLLTNFMQNLLMQIHARKLNGKTYKQDRDNSENFKRFAIKLFKYTLPNIMKSGVNTVNESNTQSSSNTRFKKFKYSESHIFDFDYLAIDERRERLESFESLVGLEYSLTLPTLLYSFALSQDLELQSSLLELIIRCFSQRKKMIENIQESYLSVASSVTQTYLYLIESINRFRVTMQECDSQIASQPENHSDISSIIQMTCTIDTFINILYLGTELNEARDEVILVGPVSEEPCSSRQTIVRNAEVHLIIIEFIRKKLWTLRGILNSKCSTRFKEAVAGVFARSYTFLISFTKGNLDNQIEIFDQFDVVFSQLTYDVGQIELLSSVK